MNVKDLRELSIEELQQKRADFREDLFRLRMRKGVAQLESPIRLRQLRRDIARIETILRERERDRGQGSEERGSDE